MKTLVRLLAPIVLTAPLIGQVTNIVSDPLGFNSVPCLIQSDTILGVPFRPNGSQQGALASAPVDNGNDTATLTLAGSPDFTADEFMDTHYVKFTSGTLDGRLFPVSTNTANTLTIFLNGDSVSTAVQDDTVIIAAYWTLDSLFPPASATTDPVTTGHAIVASTNRLSSGRMSEVLLPDLVNPGINLAPNQKFYLYNGAWRKQGESHELDFGDTQFHPDVYFIVRHSALVSQSTTFKCSGEVDLGTASVPLSSQTSGLQDNFIALPRPVDVTLDELGLIPDAFVASTNRLSSGRKDELLVFDNSLSAFNKAPSIKYYYYNGAWRKQGEDYTIDFGQDTVPAGIGFMIRKAVTVDGATVFWDNLPNYDNQP